MPMGRRPRRVGEGLRFMLPVTAAERLFPEASTPRRQRGSTTTQSITFLLILILSGRDTAKARTLGSPPGLMHT